MVLTIPSTGEGQRWGSGSADLPRSPDVPSARCDEAWVGGSLFDRVVDVLHTYYFDSAFRQEVIPSIIEESRPLAAEARCRSEERAIVTAFLSRVPASHLALLSETSHELLASHLRGQPVPTLGFELMKLEDGYFVHDLFEGGPGHRGGLRNGDRIVSIDGVEVARSDRLDWSMADATPGERPIHALLVEPGEALLLLVERVPGRLARIQVEAQEYSAFEATRASARTISTEGRRLAYIRLHYLYLAGLDELVAELLGGPFKDAEAIILDLRGRGGSAAMVRSLVSLLEIEIGSRGTPVVALVDRTSRSAKEALALDLRQREIALLVGERTAGALLPTAFHPVDDGAVLMFPFRTFPPWSDCIEGVGIEPHVRVDPARSFVGGRDPLLERGMEEAVRLLAEGDEVRPRNTPESDDLTTCGSPG